MTKRDAAERKRNPSRPERLAPAVCANCQPLLENEQRMHDEAFQALAQALDAALARAGDAETALREHLQKEWHDGVERAEMEEMWEAERNKEP